jgi:Asp-tRNA(Asn)/Glu-tRNA(Gln) amidotransferase A subunit family amidase
MNTKACPRSSNEEIQSVSETEGYGTQVDVEKISAALGETRAMRLALEVMWENITKDMEPERPEGGTYILHELDERIRDMELAVLRKRGLAQEFLIIRPISPISPPSPEIIRKITNAIRTLAELGMLVGQNDIYNTAASPSPH